MPPHPNDTLPEAPGVYLFYGENALPLYIGKSINLRERVAAHFSQDWRSETDLRLSQEIRRIEHERTAGELGALLRESVLVKSRLPAHNRALRRKEEAGIAHWIDGVPEFIAASCIDAERLSGALGPVASRASLRAALREAASEHRLCAMRLGLERRAAGPCFARQLKRCNGVCVGEEAPDIHDARLARALSPLAIPTWPVSGAAFVRECSVDGERVDVHVFRDWCWLGTARDEGDLAELAGAPPRPMFDIDVTRLLLRRYRAGALKLMPVEAQPAAACAAMTSATHAVSRFA
jgi:DNA polymerase-3 subunit epsilon